MTALPCEDCCRCVGCGLTWCRAEVVSPGEADRLCVDCWALSDGLRDWGSVA